MTIEEHMSGVLLEVTSRPEQHSGPGPGPGSTGGEGARRAWPSSPTASGPASASQRQWTRGVLTNANCNATT